MSLLWENFFQEQNQLELNKNTFSFILKTNQCEFHSIFDDFSTKFAVIIKLVRQPLNFHSKSIPCLSIQRRIATQSSILDSIYHFKAFLERSWVILYSVSPVKHMYSVCIEVKVDGHWYEHRQRLCQLLISPSREQDFIILGYLDTEVTESTIVER